MPAGNAATQGVKSKAAASHPQFHQVKSRPPLHREPSRDAPKTSAAVPPSSTYHNDRMQILREFLAQYFLLTAQDRWRRLEMAHYAA